MWDICNILPKHAISKWRVLQNKSTIYTIVHAPANQMSHQLWFHFHLRERLVLSGIVASKYGASKAGVIRFYRAVIESVLTFSIIVWFGSSTVQQKSQIRNIVWTATNTIGCDLTTIDDTCVSHLQKKGLTILRNSTHLARHFFIPLPSGRRFRAIQTKSARFLNSRMVHVLNSSGT